MTFAVLAGTMLLSLKVPPKGGQRGAYPFASKRSDRIQQGR
jgi:hypothetical protein